MENNEIDFVVQDWNQQGLALLKAGKQQLAKGKFLQAINTDPMYMESYKNMGDLYMASGEYNEAKNYYKKALLIEKSGVVWFWYGNACFMNDEPHEGLESYNRALSAGFDNDEMFFFMGMAYKHMNDDKMALRYIQKAINKNPSRPDYRVKKIELLIQMSEIGEAEKEVDRLMLSEPELFDGYHIKNAILMKKKRYKEAIDVARRASERFPEDADLLLDYAKSMAVAGKYDESMQLLENAKKLKYYEDSKEYFIQLEAEIQAELGNVSDAVRLCEECISMEKENQINESIRFMIINLYLMQEKYEEAIENAQKIIESASFDSYYFAALYFKPYALMKKGNREEAEEAYSESVKLYRLSTLKNPDAYDAYLYRAMCLRDTGKYEDALEMLELLENLDGDIAEIYTIRADIYELTKQPVLAKEELEKAYKIKPELRTEIKREGE